MESSLIALFEKMKRGPAVILLGQQTLSWELGHDPFLEEVIRKFAQSGSTANYDSLLDLRIGDNTESILAWMYDRSSRFSPPASIEAMASYPWNAAYTTMVDTIALSGFRSPSWREVLPIAEESHIPDDPRNRHRLHLHFLFGCVTQTEAGRPPLTRLEMPRRRRAAAEMLGRLPEVLTPFGVLVIDGYDPATDWLRPDELYAVLASLAPGQAHIFRCPTNLEDNEYLSALVKTGQLVPHADAAGASIAAAVQGGLLAPESFAEDEGARRIRIGNQPVSISTKQWNDWSRTLLILDESILLSPPPISKEKLYSEFREFLAESSIRARWTAFHRKFAFSRSYETLLSNLVSRLLLKKDQSNAPVLLQGQTGTGKTVALAHLAFNVCQQSQIPVAFIDRKPRRPSYADIDSFAHWNEEHGASMTLLVWDGMVEPQEYFEMLGYLNGRGRKVVIVGSTYKRDMPKIRESNVIEAPSTLAHDEVGALSDFLSRVDPNLVNWVSNLKQEEDPTFFVALYRILPPTRTMLRHGVMSELDKAAQDIQLKAERTTIGSESALAGALRRAGIANGKQTLFSGETIHFAGEKLAESDELMALVMVPGRFGLRVPIELLFRAARKRYSIEMIDVLNQDIFRWSDDEAGNVFIGPRHPLEAQIFVQRRLATAVTEVAFAEKLCLAFQSRPGASDHELEFVLQLIRCIGPNGREANYFAPQFFHVANILTKLRTERGFSNPRVMLQEAMLLREAAKASNKFGSSGMVNDDLLVTAEGVLRSALEKLDPGESREQRSQFLVEWAGLFGAKIHKAVDARKDHDEIRALYNEAKDKIFEAQQLDPTNGYAPDVLGWISEILLNSEDLDPSESCEITADVFYCLDFALGQDLQGNQRERLTQRAQSVAGLIGDSKRYQEAFDALAASGSVAGYYLKALQQMPPVPVSGYLGTSARAQCAEVYSYLQGLGDVARRDLRTVTLLFKSWWLSHAGASPFPGEREALPFSQADWLTVLELIDLLVPLSSTYMPLEYNYLTALAQFHLNRVDDSLNTFRQLERESESVRGRRRIIKSYLASNADGSPREFDGIVANVRNNGMRGDISVEQLRRTVPVFSRDIGRNEIKRNEPVSRFHIAFNFLGPIADSGTIAREGAKA